jgi:hypothetical protein
VSSSNWPAVREQFGRLRILTPSDEVTAVDVRARELGAAPARRQRIARVVLAALLVVLAGALALGCGDPLDLSGDEILRVPAEMTTMVWYVDNVRSDPVRWYLHARATDGHWSFLAPALETDAERIDCREGEQVCHAYDVGPSAPPFEWSADPLQVEGCFPCGKRAVHVRVGQ